MVAPFLKSNGRLNEDGKAYGFKRLNNPRLNLYKRYQECWADSKQQSKGYPKWFWSIEVSTTAQRLLFIIRDFYKPKTSDAIELNSKHIAQYFGSESKSAHARSLTQNKISKALNELSEIGLITWSDTIVNNHQANAYRQITINVQEGWKTRDLEQTTMYTETRERVYTETRGSVHRDEGTKPLFLKEKVLEPSVPTPSDEVKPPTPKEQGRGVALQALSPRMFLVFQAVRQNIEQMRREGSSIPFIESESYFVSSLHADNIERIESIPTDVLEEFLAQIKRGKICSPRLLRDRMDDYLDRSIERTQEKKEREAENERNALDQEFRLRELNERALLECEKRFKADPTANLQNYLPFNFIDEYITIRGSSKWASDAQKILANNTIIEALKALINS